MQVRIAADQPWDVKADVLVVPVLGQPAFTGPLGELDSRSGKELSALVDFGELRGKRFKAILAGAGGDAKVGTRRILLVNGGPASDLDRESVVKLAAASIRRLAGRKVGSLAIWLAPLADVLEGGAAAVAELVARGIVEGGYEPARIYRDGYEDGAPELKELVLVAGGEDAGRLAKAAERGTIIGEGAGTLPTGPSLTGHADIIACQATLIRRVEGTSVERSSTPPPSRASCAPTPFATSASASWSTGPRRLSSEA